MKNRSMRLSSYLLSLTLVLSLVLSACSNGNSNTNENASPSNAAGEQKEKPTITVAVLDAGNKVPAEEGTLEDNRWTKWIQENSPVNVKFIPIPQAPQEQLQKYNVLFASNSAPDLLVTYSPNFLDQFAEQRQILELSDLIDKHSTTYKKYFETDSDFKQFLSNSDGEIYALGAAKASAMTHTTVIRKDWLEKLKLEVPTTTEELLQVAKAFADKDPDGNGKPDTFGFALSGFLDWSTNFMFGMGYMNTNFKATNLVVQDGELVRDWERFEAFMDFRMKMMNDGIIDKDFLTDKNGNKAKQDFMSGRLGIITLPGFANNFQEYKSFKNNNPDGELLAIELPTSSAGQYDPYPRLPYGKSFAINASAKNPEAVMQYIDFMASESTNEVFRQGPNQEYRKPDTDSCISPLADQETIQKEVQYNSEYFFFFSNDAFYSEFNNDKCGLPNNLEKLNDPLTEPFLKNVHFPAKETYFNHEFPTVAHNDLLPVLSDDLEMIDLNATKSINDIIANALLSGGKTSAEQVAEEAKAAWEKAGGEQIDIFMNEWYTANKDTLITMEDAAKFVK